jgi:hypothetical protein
LLWGFALLLFVCGETLAIVNRLEGAWDWDDFLWLFFTLTFSLATIGALILAHHPGHAVGWLLYIVGVFFEISFFSTEYGLFTLVTQPDALPFGRELATLTWIGGTAFFLMTSLLFLLFPDGRTLSPRWNVFIVLAIAGTSIASISEWIRPGPLDAPLEAWTNPLGIDSFDRYQDTVTTVGFIFIAACGLGGAASLVLRFQRSSGILREQLKWVAFSAVVFITCWITQLLLEPLGGSDSMQQALVSVGISTIPAAAGIAILRYRLYDIDWIINRTLVYVPLTAVLAGVYIALTGVLRTLLTDSTGNSDFTIALTTLIVVAMLTPVKNYLQTLVDRHFRESRDPAKELRKLSTETRSTLEVLDHDQFARRFLASVAGVLDAPGAALQTPAQANSIIYGDWSGAAEVTLPLRNEGREIGTLSLAPRSDSRPYTPAEIDALKESAGVMAYLLRLSHQSRASTLAEM